MHIPDDPLFYEKFYFTPGDLGFRTFATPFGDLGVLICWDQWYPEAARLTAPGGRLLIVDFAPHDLEFLRAEHRHRRLGFFDSEMERWLAAGGLGEVAVRALPPSGADGAGLTVKIWSARRQAARLRKIA